MTIPPGRTREAGELRRALDAPVSTVVAVEGMSGVGTSTLARAVLPDFDAAVCVCPPLPEPRQVDAARRALQALAGAEDASDRSAPPRAGAVGLPSHSPPAPPGLSRREAEWLRALRRLLPGEPGGRRRLLLLDEAHRLSQSRARVGAALQHLLAEADRRGTPVHVILAGRAPLSPLLPAEGAHRVRVPPLRFHAARRFLPGRSAEERVMAYAVFGGVPRVLEYVDPGASVHANVRRLFLDPPAPLAAVGLDVLERSLQSPGRYAGILRAIALGERDWAGLHRFAAPDEPANRLAPYLQKLRALGAVTEHRSLDARPGSRNRRYAPADPLLGFWFRTMMPDNGEPPPGPGAAGVAGPAPVDSLLADLHHHVAGVFAEVCRQFTQDAASEALGASAREAGALWGPGYDIPVAGTLRSGAAFYGEALWADPPGEEVLRSLDRAVGETRYGFGRERRLRLICTRLPPAPALVRAAARRDDAHILTLEEVVDA